MPFFSIYCGHLQCWLYYFHTEAEAYAFLAKHKTQSGEYVTKTTPSPGIWRVTLIGEAK